VTAIVEFDPLAAEALRSAAGGDQEAVLLPSLDTLRGYLDEHPGEDCVVLGPSLDLFAAVSLAETMRLARPYLGVVLVRRRIDTPMLSEALRAGIREVVQDRDLAAAHKAVQRCHEFAAALRGQLAQRDETGGPPRRGRVVTVFSAKGGCGKTTLATNMATGIASSGRGTVALLDLDLSFGDVAIALQLFPTHTIADAAGLGPDVDADALLALLTPHSSGVQALVAPPDPSAADKVETALVMRVLDLLASHFDFVIVDTPPALDEHVLAAFDASDVVALLATLDIPALKNLKLTLETLDAIGFPRDRLRVVMNRADSKVGLNLSEVEKTLRTPIASQIPSSRDVPAATNRGVTLMSDNPRHPVSVAVRQLLEEHVYPAATSNAIPPTLRSDRRALRRKRRQA